MGFKVGVGSKNRKPKKPTTEPDRGRKKPNRKKTEPKFLESQATSNSRPADLSHSQVVSVSHTVRLWDARSEWEFDVISMWVLQNINITYKPDGTHIAVGNRDDELTILDVRKFKPIHKRKFNYEVNEIAWSTSSEIFFLTTGNVLAYPSLKPVDTLMAHTAGCYCIAIDPLGRYFAVGSANSLVSLWDISEMLCVKTFPKLDKTAHPPILKPITSLSFDHFLTLATILSDLGPNHALTVLFLGTRTRTSQWVTHHGIALARTHLTS
ncbi:THO complex subunit 3 [Pyrus ussuriensis x Pyrus communis]|uniref:THO complex subunit 3 n=1 Tax=Pyrus ussuriensis x Pyrus communis TaxID=2448454 RepID=A0A5N5GQK4_9ROSA|nr:THO complex subunit 3 [Pyrus ussuriensis x Pyrus communis]